MSWPIAAMLTKDGSSYRLIRSGGISAFKADTNLIPIPPCLDFMADPSDEIKRIEIIRFDLYITESIFILSC